MRRPSWLEISDVRRVPGKNACSMTVRIRVRCLSFGRMLWQHLDSYEPPWGLWKPVVFLWCWWKCAKLWS